MKRLNSLMYESAKKMRLKRVRIKCDPILSGSLDFASVDNYEGYILEESVDTITVMIIKQDLPVVDIKPAEAQEVKEPCLNSFKLASFKQYLTKGLQSGDPLINQIKGTSSVEEIESIMIQNNNTPEKFIQTLRKFINGKLISEQIDAPSFGQNFGRFAGNIVKDTAKGLTNLGQSAKNVNTFTDNLQQGNYGQIAKGVVEKWSAAKEEQFKKHIHSFEWPQGYPKIGSNIKIINENNKKISNKLIHVQRVTKKAGEQTVYYGSVLGVSGMLGPVGVILTVPTDTVKDHAANVRFTEGRSFSRELNKYPATGDMYVFQFNSRRHQFELVEDFLGVTSPSFKEKELVVKCDKDTKIGEEGTFVCVSRFGSGMWMQHVRAKLVSPPEYAPHDGMYYAHATPV